MSSAQVSVVLVERACKNYVASKIKKAQIDRQQMIEEAILNRGWFGPKTVAQAIKHMDNDEWNWDWCRISSAEDNAKRTVAHLVHLCRVTSDSWITVTSDDAWIINNYREVE